FHRQGQIQLEERKKQLGLNQLEV
ncbi:hypothetical protein CCACVL1_03768, partial [Corchorus capsularis]